MEKYIVSRELAEKLKAAGYPQKSTVLLWWRTKDTKPKAKQEWFWARRTPMFDVERGRDILAAPLSDELLEQLPSYITVKGDNIWLGMLRHSESVEYQYHNMGDYPIASFISSRPADSLAELWLWCKENGYLRAPDAQA